MSYIIYTIIALGGFSLKAFLIRILIHMLIGLGIYVILVLFSCYVMRNTLIKINGLGIWHIHELLLMWLNFIPIFSVAILCIAETTLPVFKWYRSPQYYYKKYDTLIKMMKSPAESDLGNEIFKNQIKDRVIQELISRKVYRS